MSCTCANTGITSKGGVPTAAAMGTMDAHWPLHLGGATGHRVRGMPGCDVSESPSCRNADLSEAFMAELTRHNAGPGARAIAPAMIDPEVLAALQAALQRDDADLHRLATFSRAVLSGGSHYRRLHLGSLDGAEEMMPWWLILLIIAAAGLVSAMIWGTSETARVSCCKRLGDLGVTCRETDACTREGAGLQECSDEKVSFVEDAFGLFTRCRTDCCAIAVGPSLSTGEVT